MDEERIDLDLGDNHSLSYFGWSPNRDLNPQYKDLPDIEKIGANISHLGKDGLICKSAVMFDSPEARQVFSDDRHFWKVESFEPLTLSPSILCRRCNDHGFIRSGKWVKA